MWTNNFPYQFLKRLVASPFPTHILLKYQRLPFVWLKCSVRILRSRLWVIGSEKWNRVMTVSVGYLGTRIYKESKHLLEAVLATLSMTYHLFQLVPFCYCNYGHPCIPPLPNNVTPSNLYIKRVKLCIYILFCSHLFVPQVIWCQICDILNGISHLLWDLLQSCSSELSLQLSYPSQRSSFDMQRPLLHVNWMLSWQTWYTEKITISKLIAHFRQGVRISYTICFRNVTISHGNIWWSNTAQFITDSSSQWQYNAMPMSTYCTFNYQST